MLNFRDTTNPDHKAFYVSAFDDRNEPRLAAGPYASHEAALERVAPVKDHIIAIRPECHWWFWGTCSAPEPLEIKIPLGAF